MLHRSDPVSKGEGGNVEDGGTYAGDSSGGVEEDSLKSDIGPCQR